MDPLALLSPDTTASLSRIAWEEPERARRLLSRLAERAGSPPEAVPFLETVLAALPEAADPEMALLHLERWSSALSTPVSTLSLLREDPRLLADLLALFGSSQYLADILVRDPWLYGLFLEPDAPRSAEDYAAAVSAALRPLRRPESRRDALRRVKRREFLRIGWRDLARQAPLEEIVREISDLADALVQAALALAREEIAPRFPLASGAVRFAVVAMGKLGARELNYSSDIDLIFVMDSPDPHDEGHRQYAARLAETLVAVLTAETGEGRCFRVDLRLRPEGRMGPLVRSLQGYHDYYDRWVETWERQALIKARFIAGDEELGRRFEALIRPVVYRRLQGLAVLEDLRENRALVERKLEASGVMDQHVKEGRGTIREVEFSVQLLQLLFGADRPELQVRDTLTALDRLHAVGLLAADEYAAFRDGYRFFRKVEHRLQLLHDLPERLLPSEPRELRRLARSMGFPDAASFREAYRTHSERVARLAAEIRARLGARESGTGEADALRTAAMAADTPAGAATIRRELERLGFPEPAAALDAFVRLATGDPRSPHPTSTRRVFADLAPAVLAECAAAADPTWALEGLEEAAARQFLHRGFYQMLLEHPEVLRARCRFAGAAPTATRILLRYPELADLVTDAEQLRRRRSLAELRRDLADRLAGAPDWQRRLAVLRRFKWREFIRLAARHVLAPVPPEQETAEWSDVAHVLVEAALEAARIRLGAEGRWPRHDPGAFAVFALGRFGGRDLHFASDLDLLYVHDHASGLGHQQYEHLAQVLGEALQTVTEDGRLFEIDLRLRPEGRQGFAVVGLEAARRYYGEGGRAQTWEFQTLTRLRWVAGSEETARRFAAVVEPRIYRNPMPASWREEIRAMKRRIETERVAPRERDRHLKLGPGSLADIEFLVQFLQLAHGGADPRLRLASTVEAIRALEAAGWLEAEAARQLLEAHAFLTRLRQALYLLRPDGPWDALPVEPPEARVARALARALGFPDPPSLHAAYRAVTQPVRQQFERALG